MSYNKIEIPSENIKKELTKEQIQEIIENQKKELKYIDENFRKQNEPIFSHLKNLCEKYNLQPDLVHGLEIFTYRVLTVGVVNGVCPINIGCVIDKDKVIAACIKNNLPYKLCQKFSGLPVKFNKNGVKFTATFFKSGKINVVGLSNDSPSHLDSVVDIIKEYEMDFFEKPVMSTCTKRFANRVYAIKVPKLIDLSDLQLFNRLSTWKNIKYNSQTFPGVRLKFENFKSKALLFKTGSMILTGIISSNCKRKLLIQILSCLAEYVYVAYNK